MKPAPHTVVYCGRLKEFRVLNMESGSLYSQAYATWFDARFNAPNFQSVVPAFKSEEEDFANRPRVEFSIRQNRFGNFVAYKGRESVVNFGDLSGLTTYLVRHFGLISFKEGPWKAEADKWLAYHY